MTFTVICRSCGDEQQVRFRDRSASSPGEFVPDYCRGCESTDLVALRDLSQAEIEEIGRAVRDLQVHPSSSKALEYGAGETPRAPREAESTSE